MNKALCQKACNEGKTQYYDQIDGKWVLCKVKLCVPTQSSRCSCRDNVDSQPSRPAPEEEE